MEAIGAVEIEDVTPGEYLALEEILGASPDDANNLMPLLGTDIISKMAERAQEGYQADENSRSSWMTIQDKIDKLVETTSEPKNFPFDNAANVKYPLVQEATLQFNARAYSTIMNNGNIALAKVIGRDEDGTKKQRADRVSRDMSYQLTEEMDGWDEETDRLLMAVPERGCAFKKVYYDAVARENVSTFVQAKDLVVNNSTRSLKSCPRISHLMPVYSYEVAEKIAMGEWDEDANDIFDDEDPAAERIIVEQQFLFDVDGDGYPEPYIITFDKDSGKVVRVVADFFEESIVRNGDFIVSIERNQYYAKYECFPSANGEFYTHGFGSLLFGSNQTVNTIINQLIDAGTLANSQSGFLGREFRVRGGSTTFTLGEFKKTDVPSMMLKDSILPLPVREPSMVLFNTLGMLIESAKGLASIQDVMTGDAPANQPAATTLALIEQGMKVYNTIFKRIYRGLRDELRLIFELNKKYRDPEKYGAVLDDPNASVEDYQADNMDIAPAADPTMATDLQRQLRMQALLQSMEQPFVNRQAIWTDYVRELGVDDPEKYILQAPEGPTPEQMESLAKLENERMLTNIKQQEADNDSRKTMAEVLKDLQEVADKGGDLGAALAEVGLIDLFNIQQKQQLQQLQTGDNRAQSVQQPAGIPGMEEGQPMAMAPSETPDGVQ